MFRMLGHLQSQPPVPAGYVDHPGTRFDHCSGPAMHPVQELINKQTVLEPLVYNRHDFKGNNNPWPMTPKA